MAGLLLFAWLCTLALGEEVREDEVGSDIGISSLLQKGIRLSLGQPLFNSSVDVPEASWAWALYQEVRPGPFNRSLMSNTTYVAPPSHLRRNTTPLAVNKGDSYYQPTVNNVPSWLAGCLGGRFNPNDYTSWYVYKVTMPQLVPFIVPMDHPNRTDVSVVIAPGGGGEFLAWQNEGTDLAKWLNLLGISAFVLKYRVSREMWSPTAAFLDAQRAMSLVRHAAPSLSLNPNRIGMVGSSHGGEMALITAFAAQRSYPRQDVVDDVSFKPDFLILAYPGMDLGNYIDTLTRQSTEYDGITLAKLSSASLLPIFVASGAEDVCTGVDGLYHFHSELRKFANDAPVEINIYDGLGHGFANCYRHEGGGWEGMQHEGCMWVLRARRFIMWQVEHKHPSDVDYWYKQIEKFDTSLISTSDSLSRVHRGKQ